MSLHMQDQHARARFITEIDRSFSVLAPAGVGKTHSIVQRILTLSRVAQPNPNSTLRNLAIVTYTRKAAREMRERTLNAWVCQGGKGALGHDLEHAFFGTIHSFCLELIKLHGHLLGLSNRLELVDARDVLLWEDFLASPAGMHIQSSHPQHPWIAKLLQFNDLVSIAQRLPAHYNKVPLVSAAPAGLDFSEIEHYEAPKAQLKRGVLKGQMALRAWQEAMQREDFSPVGFVDFKTGGDDFLELCNKLFKPLKDWASAQALVMAYGIRKAFKRYCAEQGWISYEDMVLLANKVMEEPAVAKHFAMNPMRIILDEAQDTDQLQFKLLLRACAVEVGLNSIPARDAIKGSFSMVGDPQQAIYSSRAHVSVYEHLHHALVSGGALEELKFQVTYRCGAHIVSAVNDIFPNVLSSQKPLQVAFNPLVPLEAPHLGQVVRIALAPQKAFDTKLAESVRALDFTESFANWLSTQSLSDLRAAGWEDVAILCPRNNWLDPLARALEKRGIACQVRSKQKVPLDDPAHAWALGLMAIMADPWDAFEIVGVLREVFGQSDHDIAQYVREFASKDIHPLQIAQQPAQSAGSVGSLLNELHLLWQDISTLPLSQSLSTLFARTQLLARLSLLPTVNVDKVRATLENLCCMAAMAEVDQQGLVDFVKGLVERSETPVDNSELESGKVQLLTCHSAKGLQWASVIVPYMFRPITYARPCYPQLLYSERLDEIALKMDAAHDWPVLEHTLADEASAELGRLMYVTMTRAKHSLILIDDRAFWAGLPSGASLAQAAHILLGDANHDIFMALPSMLSPAATPFESVAASQPSIHGKVIDCTGLAELTTAQQKSRQFFAQILPSSLAIHPEPFELSVKDSRHLGGADYGNAWHSLMEHLPWRAPQHDWEAYFKKNESRFPSTSTERARAEWALFKSTVFLRILEDPAWSIRTELKFLAQIPGQAAAYQGIIDFVAYHPVQNKFLVIDWKTDALPLDGVEALVLRYQPQLEAYRSSLLQAFPGSEVQLGLYSTRLGSLSWL